MKKYLKFIRTGFAVSLSVLMLSCEKPEVTPDDPGKDEPGTENPEPENPSVGETVTIRISADGEWAEDDKIGLRLPASGTTNTAAAYGADAFTAEIATPEQGESIYAYYPYTPTAADGKFTVTIPASVNGAGGTVKAMVATPAAVGEVAETIETKLVFSDVLGAVSFSLSDATDAKELAESQILKLTVTSENEISGIWTVGIEDGALTLAEGEKSISITPDAGTVFGTEAKVFTIAAAPGTFTATVKVDTDASSQEFPVQLQVTAGNTAAAELTYTETVDKYEGITSAEDFNTFIEGLIAGEYTRFVNPETGEVDLNADIEAESQFTYPSASAGDNLDFNGIFNGNNHTITLGAMTHPIFNCIGESGVVKNLTIRGECHALANAGMAGTAAVAKINRGKISGVINYVNAEVKITSDGCVFGMICAQNGGIIENCKNYGNISINLGTSTNVAFYGGGISAIGHTVLGGSSGSSLDTDDTCKAGQFIDCENHGNIYALGTGAASTKNAYGGICGLVYFDGVKISGCKNFGDISRISGDGQEISSTYCSAAGGILGRSAAWAISASTTGALENGDNIGYEITIENCTNEGTILVQCRHSSGVTNNGTGARFDTAGGIAGAVIGKEGSKTAVIKGCTNTGTVMGGWSKDVNTTVLGGIAGLANATEITDCTSKCKVESTNDTKPVGAAGGVVGFARKSVNITGGTVKAEINVYQAGTKPLLYGLLFGNISGTGSAKNAKVAGSISVGGSSVAEINSANFEQYIVSSGTLAQPETSGLTWYAE